MADPRHLRGIAAEAAVARCLEQGGWLILARRWRCASGELDLVCREPTGVLVGVEVRLRRDGRAGSALESVTPRHLRRLRATLAAYAAEHPGPRRGVRLYLVAVRPAPRPGHWIVRRVPSVDGW